MSRLLPLLFILLLTAGCADDEHTVSFDDAPADDAAPGDEGDAGEGGEEPDVVDPPDNAEADPDGGEAGGVDEVTVWVVRDGDPRWLESERRSLAEPTVAVADAAMTQLLTEPPLDPALAAPAQTDAVSVAVDDGVLTMTVDAPLTDVVDPAVLEQAVAHTAATLDGVDAAQLVPADGDLDDVSSEPVEPDGAYVAPIDVTAPQAGEAHVAGEPLTVAGTALTFESTVELELVDPDGAQVEATFATAETAAAFDRGPFTATFDAAPSQPGTWTVVATEPDPSEGEGRTPHEVRVPVDVE